MADLEAVPPGPVQVNVKVRVGAKRLFAAEAEPLVGLVPDQVCAAPAQSPDAVQLVALVELQVTVAVCRMLIEDGEIVSVTVGSG